MKATAYEGGWTVERLAIVRRPWRVVATPSGDRWLATNEHTLDSASGECASVFDAWARGYAYVLSTGTIHARPPTTSGAAAALLLVYAAAKADPSRWWGRHARAATGAHVIPEDGWLGRWDPQDSWQTLDVLPSALETILEGSSYDVRVLDLWREQGWVAHERRTVGVRIYGQVTRVIRISRKAIEDAEASCAPKEA